MIDWEYKKEFYSEAWISTIRNPAKIGNLICLIRWFLSVKSEQGWEVAEFFPHVLNDESGVQRGIIVIFKRPKKVVVLSPDPF